MPDYGGAFKATKGLLEAFGRQRIFNTPISEAAICGTAVGAAMVGLRPVVELMYMDFALMASRHNPIFSRPRFCQTRTILCRRQGAFSRGECSMVYGLWFSWERGLNMAQAIIMPKMGQTVEEATLIRWHKKETDVVAKGDILFEIETDKAVLEVESFFEGTLLKIFTGEGETVPVNSTVAYLGKPGEEAPAQPVVQKTEVREQTPEQPTAELVGRASRPTDVADGRGRPSYSKTASGAEVTTSNQDVIQPGTKNQER